MGILTGISTQERVNFAKNLAIMLHSGIAINDALDALSQQSTSGRFKRNITEVQKDIENGTSLSSSFRKQERAFGSIFVSLIEAGERSGTLQGNLQFLAEWLSRSADLHREVSAAMLYPKLVFGASILLGGGLAVFILPMLVPLFSELDVDLPGITVTLLAISLFVQQYWYWCALAVAALVALLLLLNRVHAIRCVFHSIYIRLPFFGVFLRNYQLALVTQLFGTLLKSGLSLNESIGIVAASASNEEYKTALQEIRVRTERGTSLSESLLEYPLLFPAIVRNIIAVGEQSGTLVESFLHLSDFYTKEVNVQAKKLPTIIEPLLLIFIALIVGFVALAIIMPIYELTGSISR